MPMRRLSRKVPLSGKWEPKEYTLLFNVLEANPGHVKALLCRRGMANLEVGDFEEAMGDFEMMMKADKSFEPDATAAFKKLKQKQAGCGEEGKEKIADAGTDNRGEEQSTNENDQEKDGSLSCGQLVEDFVQLLGFKDARYCDKALGLGGSSIISINWLANSDFERKKTY
ncbi:hypothetical protein NC652_016177 [Populus alba x Populus x berolinensis]|nr:hypothetical protein NC652_016177 [Populus alba x Populus x berolinensis]